MRYILACVLVLVTVPALAATATLSWTDSIGNEAGYHVERAVGACSATGLNFARIAETGANVKTYVDNSAVDGNRYCYRVRAYNYPFGNVDSESIQYGTYSNTAGKDFPLAGPAGTVLLTVS